jgi:hypothetical protein
MIRLVNGNTQQRVRNSEGCTVLDCGCAHTAIEYLQMCDKHFTEWQKLHERASQAPRE